MRLIDLWRGLLLLSASTATFATTNEQTEAVLVPFALDPLPLGSVTPNGWLRTELETSAAGLGGHLFDFWSFVANSSWIGGDSEYSDLNEALPYWVNAMVPLSYTLQDERLKSNVHYVVDTILDRIQSDGWIGPETLAGGERMIWARTLLFLGWTNLVEANATYEKPIIDAMHHFNRLMNTMLKNNGTGMIWHEGDKLSPSDYVWFISRTEDMMVSLQWLIDHYPGNQTDVSKENIDLIHHFGSKWEAWYTNGTYVTQDLYDVPASVTTDQWQFLHGVTTAKDGVDWTFEYHGAASGTILADERLDGVNPYYGSELCTDVETIYSLSYNYFAIGDNDYADRAERAAFNALPAAVSGDWWSHQYMTQPNQPYSKNLSSTPFWDVNTQGQTFGLEPNYPCCTVNHPQGYPKFTMYSWLKKGDTGLVHALLSPSHVETQVAGGNVTVDCHTDYPFRNELTYTITTEKTFDFYVRVPGWATGSTISSSDKGQQAGELDPKSGLRGIEVSSGTTTIEYNISEIASKFRTEPRANDTIAVYQGPLLYAIHIPPVVSSGPPKLYNNQQPFAPGTYPPQAHDYQMLNSTEWNVAIDPSTITYYDGGENTALPQPTWDDGQLPMYMIAKACLIDWPLFRGSVPGWPIRKEDRKCLGDAFNATLRPYGSAKLHMAEIPTIDL
ncbi:CAZyme family GH127 [Paecilomyces variotii]|nr:CAZyme family GH127 [Paecilomyces variotii]